MTRFVVLKVDLDAKRASCFVNPVCDHPEPAQAQATADLSAGPQPWRGKGLDALFLECGLWKAGIDAEHLIGRVEYDELRIGTTWADVTPAGRPPANRAKSP